MRPERVTRPPARGRRARWLLPAVALTVLLLALQALRAELRGHSYHEIAAAVRAIPAEQVHLALLCTLIVFAILPAYDALALSYVGRLRPHDIEEKPGGSPLNHVGIRRAALAAVIGYGVSQTVGFAALSGTAVRYRFWTAWGLTATEIVRAAAFLGVTFVLGIALLCGTALTLEPASELSALQASPGVARLAGVILLLAVAACAGWALRVPGRILRLPRALARRLGGAAAGWEFVTPSRGLVAGQLIVPLLDWSCGALVLWVLLPAHARPAFAAFTGVFVVAQFAGLASHVPAGAGIFDTVMVLALRPFMSAGDAMAAVIAYRGVYYVLPFAGALTLFALWEAHRRPAVQAAAQTAARSMAAVGTAAGSAGALFATLGAALVPGALAAAVFAGGSVLLLSGATPSLHDRVAALLRLMPLQVLEVSHIMASVMGTLLLVLSWALWRRLRVAWVLTLGVLGVGIVTSLLKGLDWEEALALTAVAAGVLPFRRAFFRRSALTSEPFEPGWVLAILAVLGVSVTVGLFSYQHVEYDRTLWWMTRPRGDAPRFLRASLASALVLAFLATARLLGRAKRTDLAPQPADRARAADIALHSRDTTAYLALLGDKALLFTDENERGGPDGFIQYSVVGRSWIALGDPVVAPVSADARFDAQVVSRARAELAWRFTRDAEVHEGWPVFYGAGTEALSIYIDLGLTFVKLGEDARVDLGTFSLEGGSRKGLRRALRDGERAGLVFSVIPPDGVPALLPEMRRVSDDWLATRNVREKGFSLGYFDETYLRAFPAAVVRGQPDDVLLAFANIWPGAEHHELSVDLMRHAAAAPKETMDFLFVQLMQWGKAQGYHWFDLGMAPLAGLEARDLAPVWARAGAWLYRHGEHFYNYQGLRAYKAKFDPVWEPKYLASPGGLALPRILANVVTLISGGLLGAVRR